LTSITKNVIFFHRYCPWELTQGKDVNSEKYDFVIVGAGILGLSVAHALTNQYPFAKIILLEKEKSLGLHASGRNSGVLHSGIYYPKDSLKAKVCADGAKRMFNFANDNHILCHKTGKVIIAASPSDLPTLDFLLKNAAHNQITALRIDAKQIHDLEPNANAAYGGIFTPDTACIDSKQVLEKLSAIILSRRAKIYFQQGIEAINKKKQQAFTKTHTFSYGYLFNTAGAWTDKIAKMFGLARDYRLVPFKGIYYKLKKDKNHLVNSNIYPVPDLQLPFLGVHFSKNIFGDVYAGPTAIPAFGRENYGIVQGMNVEAVRIMKDILLMYAANQQNFRKLIHTEIKKYHKKSFIHCAKKLIPNIAMHDLIPADKVGIRPQLINIKQKKIEMDYIIEQDAYSMHVLNAISPAFTSAFSFAELLVNRM
jgi:(S)-2-hydroxyglutarate dehydrogenase